MIHPASDKLVALTCVATEAMEQGSLVVMADLGDGTGRLKATKVATTGDLDGGTYFAYFITPDSEDVEFIGAPETTTFTLNTDTGVGGGLQTIASGSEMVGLGGKNALLRLDVNSVFESVLTSHTGGTLLKVEATDGFLALDANDDIDQNVAMVIANDGITVVVLVL